MSTAWPTAACRQSVTRTTTVLLTGRASSTLTHVPVQHSRHSAPGQLGRPCRRQRLGLVEHSFHSTRLKFKPPANVTSTPCLKNIPPLACYNSDTCERILLVFGKNVTDKVPNQKTLYYAASINLCFCTTW